MSLSTMETVVLLIRIMGTLTPISVRIDFQGRHRLKKTHFYESGVRYPCHTWERVDGEIDTYPEVLEEARANGLNPQFDQATYSQPIEHSNAVKAPSAP